MKSKASRIVVVIAVISAVIMILVVLGRREVKAGSSTITQEFPLSVSDSVYDEEGFFENYCGSYSDYDEICSMTVSLQGEWKNGRIYLTLVDDAGNVFGNWSYSSPQEVSEKIICNKPIKGLLLQYRVEKGAVGNWTVTYEETVLAYKKWFK